MAEERDRDAYATAHAVFHGTAEDAALWPAVVALRGSDRRFTLIADCLRAAAAAGHALPGELAPIRRLAAALAIEPAQLIAIATSVVAGETVAALAEVAAAGAPAGAVAGSASEPRPLAYAGVAGACDRIFDRR